MKSKRIIVLFVLIAQVFLGGCATGGTDFGQQPSSTPSAIRLPPQWTATPWPDPNSEVLQESVGEWAACPDDPSIPLSLLKAGQSAVVTSDIVRTIQLRDIAGWSGSQVVASLQPGEQVEILEGPVCLDQFIWWRVHSVVYAVDGWTIEGNQYESWLLPKK
ncbi:MAG: hypothetical protein JXA25_15380 [Anaerolineales bacterium]|nr:hypothetical protein [Anaerolineales bacterium]